MNMQTFFSEITALCRNEQFLHSVMEKYHYDPEEYPNLKRLAGEMIPCLETEAGWQDREIKETFRLSSHKTNNWNIVQCCCSFSK